MVAFFGVTAPTASGRPRTRYVKVTTGIDYYVWLTSRFTLSLLLSKREQPRPQCLSTLAVGPNTLPLRQDAILILILILIQNPRMILNLNLFFDFFGMVIADCT